MAVIKDATIAATGAGESVVLTKGWVNLRGTWVGTVSLQNEVEPGTWADATDGAGTEIAWTGAVSCPIDNAVPLPTRVYFTRTSGTLEYTLRGEPSQP